VTPESIVYVNFNYQVPNATSPWNNLATLPNEVGEFPDMTDQSGLNTGILLAMEKPFNGEFNAGRSTLNNSGVVPDNALLANYWLDNTQISTVRASGLNHTKRYRFGFFGSSAPLGWYKGNYTATYSIGNRTVYLNSWENTTQIVYISNVAPDANGDVLITFSTTEAANYGFNGGMILMTYNDNDTTSQVDGARRLVQAPIVQVEREEVQLSSNQSMRAYPNPFIQQLNIDYFNNAASNKITLEIVDMSGRIAYQKYLGQVSEGANTLRISTNQSLRGVGVYSVNLKVNGKIVASKKLLKTNQ
jgi:hypothetical protein